MNDNIYKSSELTLGDLKNELGEPRKGLHESRVNLFGLDIAFNDFMGTFVLGIILTLIIGTPIYLKMKLHRLKRYDLFIFWISILIPSTIFMFILGIILHRIFKVQTAI